MEFTSNKHAVSGHPVVEELLHNYLSVTPSDSKQVATIHASFLKFKRGKSDFSNSLHENRTSFLY